MASKRKAEDDKKDGGGIESSTPEKRVKLDGLKLEPNGTSPHPPPLPSSTPEPPAPFPLPPSDDLSSSPEDASASLPTDSAGVVWCPYLDTVERRLLDFDFSKLCSVSLSNLNVYCCLVCGKYYQGRGVRSLAYFHSVQASHHVFINLHTQRVYCLPDGYEVHDPSLHDIQFNLHPTYTQRDLRLLDDLRTARGLDGSEYIVGLMGLNNIHRNDWLNVVVQALVRITPLRDYFLLATSTTAPTSSSSATSLSLSSSVRSSSSPSLLTPYFTELLCKLANPRSFKGHVSPHELIQAVTTASDRQFRLGEQSDPLLFLSFFLNRLHRELGGEPGAGRGKGKKGQHGAETIVSRCFQGEVKVMVTRKKKQRQQQQPAEGEKKASNEDADSDSDLDESDPSTLTTSTSYTPFFYLSLKLPSAPLFKGSQQQTIIPQIPLYDLLARFNSRTVVYGQGSRTRYALTRLPRYLIVHYQRFADNAFFTEKNPTLVTFPLRGLDLRDLLDRSDERGSVDSMTVRELMEEARSKGWDVAGVVELDELRQRVRDGRAGGGTTYDLISNIVHEGDAKSGKYRIHVLHRPNATWYEIDDLRVSTSETIAQIVGLSEAYIQVYERRK